MSPSNSGGYAPGIAVRDCDRCQPYALLYKDAYEGGVFGAGKFVLDHEVGHLLCLGHEPDGSSSVMRTTIFGNVGEDEVPQVASVTKSTLEKAHAERSVGCIGPVDASIR